MRRHNKKRNSALLYEFLIRHISHCLLNNKKKEANRALSISKEYFSKGPLREELNLFKALVKTVVASKQSAEKIINEIYSQASRINVRNLDREKSKLIKEINYTFNASVFYNYKIPNYVIYASAHTLLDEKRNKRKVLSNIDKIGLEDRLLEHLTRKDDKSLISESLKANPKYNKAVYKFVVNNFHKKYEGKLSESQKRLLTKYAVYSMSQNDGVIRSTIDKEVKLIKESLKSIKDNKILENKELMSKISECYKKLAVTNFDDVCEESVLKVLQYMSLVDEVNS